MLMSRMTLLAVFALTGCGGPDVPAATAESSAAALQAVLPRDIGFGAIVSSASAEANVLVLQVDHVVEVDVANADHLAGESVKALACRDTTYRTVISNGIDIRFDLTGQSGRVLPSTTLEECA
jgi:hypothetical protein